MSTRLTVKDIAPEQFGAWHSHPVTVFMLQYYRDFARALEAKMLADWKANKSLLSDELEARGRVLTLDEIATIDWPSIQKFYNIEPKQTEEPNEESDAATSDEQQFD